jgi:hypothetical protein
MQARELTPQEVAEGQRGITDQKLSATQVQALVRQMDASKKRHQRLKRSGQMKEYEEALKKDNELLYFNFPSLFDLHKEDKLDQTFFEMLALKRKIEKGEITAEQASSVVGQQLFNRFVPHVISNSAPPAPRMSYEDFYKNSSNT